MATYDKLESFMWQRDTAHLVDILAAASFFKLHYDERRRLLVTVHLPEELMHLLEPASIEREVLEGLLLKLVAEGRVSLGKAAELLTMDRLEAIRWYTHHGLPYPNLTQDEIEDEIRAGLERF